MAEENGGDQKLGGFKHFVRAVGGYFKEMPSRAISGIDEDPFDKRVRQIRESLSHLPGQSNNGHRTPEPPRRTT